MQRDAAYLAAIASAFVHNSGPVAPPADLPWAAFRESLVDHGVVSMLELLIDRDTAPPEEAELLTTIGRGVRRRAGLMLLELERILPALEENEFKPIVLKGAALSETVYYRPGVRSFADIDLLVERDAVDDVCQVLKKFGYDNPPLRRHPSFYADHHFHRILRNRVGMVLEVHWDLARPASGVRFDLPELRSRVVQTPIKGLPTRVLDPGDQLLHITAQQVSDGFRSLLRLIDTAMLLQAGAGASADLAARAKRYNLAHALWLNLALCNSVVQVPAPKSLFEAVRPSSRRQWLAESLDLPQAVLSGFLSRRAGGRNLVRWLCCPTVPDSLAEIRRYVTPGEAEWLDAGYSPQRLPAWPERMKVGVTRLWSLARITGYVGWRAASQVARRDTNISPAH